MVHTTPPITGRTARGYRRRRSARQSHQRGHGLPAIVVPAGVNKEGLPIAIEFLGRPFSEPKLIQLADAYEQASRRRVAPNSTPHLLGEVFSY